MTCYFLEQMWKIDGENNLLNKADVWKSKDKWKFKPVSSTKVLVENISNKTLLGIDDETTVIEEPISENNAGQIWCIGIPSKDGYFTLTANSSKLLTASSAYNLEIKGENRSI